MVFMIIIPFLNGYFIGNIYPTFSDKPISLHISASSVTHYTHYRFFLALQTNIFRQTYLLRQAFALHVLTPHRRQRVHGCLREAQQRRAQAQLCQLRRQRPGLLPRHGGHQLLGTEVGKSISKHEKNMGKKHGKIKGNRKIMENRL